jgi:hypothetical protein
MYVGTALLVIVAGILIAIFLSGTIGTIVAAIGIVGLLVSIFTGNRGATV